MSMTNAYIPGLRAAVGHGLPGRPQRGSSGASAAGQIVIAVEAPAQGEWLPLDGSVWDDRLDATDIPGGAFYDEGSLYTVATGQADSVIGWLPDDRGFFTYQYSSKNLRRYLMGGVVALQRLPIKASTDGFSF